MKTIKSVVLFLLIIVFISSTAITIFLISNLDNSTKKKEINDSFEKVVEKIDDKYNDKIVIDKIEVNKYFALVDALKKEFNNPDIKGTINIPGTDINTAFVQTTDNEFYLNHAIDKSESKIGSAFMDYRNTLIDKAIVMYGHNSRTLKPIFHSLENYTSESFFNEYNQITLTTEFGEYNYVVFSVMILEKTDTQHVEINFTSEEEYNAQLEWIKLNSIYNTSIEVNSNDNILLLQTCYYYPKNSYLVIVAKRVN